MFNKNMVARMFGVGLIFSIACCCDISPIGFSSQANASGAEEKPETIERDYFVKGMTCAGCVFGVKKALERAGVARTEIVAVEYDKPDPENKIGHAKVRFSKLNYHGKNTDCKIVKEILSNPGYVAFWEESNQNPCN